MRTIACAVTIAALTTAHLSAAQDRSRVPQGPSGTVTLPLTEYNQLIDRASRPEKRVEQPPIPAVVSRADLRARVSADMARGTLRLDGEVYRSGPTKVALVTGATLVDARTDGRPLPLLSESDTHAAILPGPAPFSVTLDWTTPLASAPGRAAFTLPVPAGSSASATLDLPGDPADVRVEPGLITRRQSSGGRTTIDVTLEPGHRAQVSWSVRETAAATASHVESRTLADVKSLVTVGDADLRMISLVDITVLQGDPRTFDIRVPRGFEVTAVSGGTVETNEIRGDVVTLTVRDPGERRHQFLLSLEQAHAPGSFKLDTSFPTVPGVQRESGEVAVEGVGTMELTATGDEAIMRRMDVRETNLALQSLARQSLLAAFRYQRRGDEVRTLTLDVKRFADAAVLAAIAERATVTTLVTNEGRALTEVELRVRNRAQPFMKVTLPPGATIVSVEIAGESAKPVQGADGTRVPLLRPGFRPADAYRVSFVYQHAGTAFEKSGDMQMALPAIDLPVTLLNWELYLPERYRVKPTGGNAIPSEMVERALLAEREQYGVEEGVPGGVVGGVVGGLPGAPPPPPPPEVEPETQNAPSQNVLNLQRRVAGVLPVRVDVPRSGASYRFVRPLVLGDETTVSFRYKKR